MILFNYFIRNIMDNFTRLKKIGRGNFGDVWLVERKSDGHVKLLIV